MITQYGDLLITCKGTVGELAINTFGDSHIARQIMAIRNDFSLDIEFTKVCISYYVNILVHKSKGIIPGISRDDILNILLPFPPLDEQKKIIKILSLYYDIISMIEANLS